MDKIIECSSYIKRNVKWLNNLLSNKSIEEILGDYGLYNAVLYVLQSSIEALIDIMYRTIALMGEKPPSSYSDAPFILAEKEILENKAIGKINELVGLRNILVHRYTELNREVIADVLVNRKYLDIYHYAAKILKNALKEEK